MCRDPLTTFIASLFDTFIDRDRPVDECGHACKYTHTPDSRNRFARAEVENVFQDLLSFVTA